MNADLKQQRLNLGLIIIVLLVALAGFRRNGGDSGGGQVITGVNFNRSSHRRLAPGSDNWCTTVADDGHIYTAWGDGGGFNGTNQNGRVSLGVGRVSGPGSNYSVANINGGVSPLSGRRDWPDGGTEGKSYGMVCIGGFIYMWVTGGRTSNFFDFARLYRSTDHGARWSTTGVQFTHTGEGLSIPTILNFGQNYSGARDSFVYHYFIETRDPSPGLNVQKPGRIHLLRCPISSIGSKSAYEYFAGTPGNPAWSSSRQDSQPVFTDPNGAGWAVAVCYNPGLRRYILTTPHESFNSGGNKPRAFGMFDAPEPWGPWHTILYVNGNWENFNNSRGEGDTTFYWNFPTKWFSADGRDFTMVFTGGNPGFLDSWNTIQGRFQV